MKRATDSVIDAKENYVQEHSVRAFREKRKSEKSNSASNRAKYSQALNHRACDGSKSRNLALQNERNHLVDNSQPSFDINLKYKYKHQPWGVSIKRAR